MSRARKQAVILIHGVGEQRPMDTLRGFVEAVWLRDKAIHHPHVKGRMWSKPDGVSRSFELRRLTTTQNRAGLKTDFLEFYWAHLMKGTRHGHVLAWLRSLVFRRPGKVPRHLRSVYWLLVVLLTGAFALASHAACAEAARTEAWLPPWVSALGAVLLLPLATFVLLRIVGDAARYLHVAAPNIQRRHEIRQAGLALLKTLHEPGRDYERIIVVGHSLGSVIGYDILTHAWADFAERYSPPHGAPMSALETLEALGRDGCSTAAQIQAAQRAYFDELRRNGGAWRVTDFITLGSPLAHAAVLLADDAEDLAAKQADREFPCCPPALEDSIEGGQVRRRFSFWRAPKHKGDCRVPHHAAVFAATRWTNLYFPCRAVIVGDLVGGPLAGVMGRGVRDIAVATRQWAGLFSHTLYWSRPKKTGPAAHIEALREALDLADERDAAPPMFAATDEDAMAED